MLDINTSALLLTANMLLQAVGWLLIWLTQRRIYQLNLLAAGFAMYAASMVLLLLRDAMAAPSTLIIIVHNVAIVIANALVVQGLASFLGQRGFPVLLIGCVVVTMIVWPVAMIVDPSNVGIRVLMHNMLNTISAAALICIILRDHTQPAVLRWSTILLMISEIVALAVRSIVTIRIMGTPGITFDATLQAWYFFFFNIFITAFFILLLIMVGNKLAADLRQKNEALQREVGERGRLQDQLSATLQTEQALRQEQKQLLRMVTHEFRTPLAIVDRAAEMIDVTMPDRPEAVTKRLDSIRDAVTRLVQLIDRFLDSERRAVNVVQPERIDIQSLLNGVRRHFEGIDAASRLFFIAAGDLPFYRGDPEMLSTVLINLIDNAMKYAPGDSPIEIAARTETGTGTGTGADAIVITVTDHGIGIPDAELASIGQRFFRASNTTAATGTGLGLYNARRLLEYHNATLSLRPVSRDHGRTGGTEATIRLPLPGVAAPLEMSEA